MDSIAFFRSSSKRANNCLRLTSSFSLFSLMRPSASARAFSLWMLFSSSAYGAIKACQSTVEMSAEL